MAKPNAGVRCGTPSGYNKHKISGEKPCDACAKAKADYDKRFRSAPERVKKNRASSRAQNRAMMRLKDLYPDVYRALYEEEKITAFREFGLPIEAVRNY